MIFKEKKSSRLAKSVKFFVIAELAVFIGSYTAYAACNRSQSNRKFLRDTKILNPVLEFYYQIGEKFGTNKVREYDNYIWYGVEPTSFKIKKD